MAETRQEATDERNAAERKAGRHLPGATAMSDRGLIDLKFLADAGIAREKASAIFGLRLPEAAGRSATSAGKSAILLARNHWLVACPMADHAAALASLDNVLPRGSYAMTNVSGAWRVFRLSPNTAAHLVARYDPDHSGVAALSESTVLRLRVGSASVILNAVSTSPFVGEAYVRRSDAARFLELLDAPAKPAGEIEVFRRHEPPPV